MENLISANIRSRPTRTFISILAVALGVTLMLVIGGFVTGSLNDSMERTIAMGADFILQPPGSSAFYAFSDANLNEDLLQVVKESPGVAAVTPVLSEFSLSDFSLTFGIDLASYNQFPGRLEIVSGKASLKENEVIVDQLYADSNKIRVGMPLTVLGNEFKVSGICRPGSVVRKFISLRTLQELKGAQNRVTIMFIKARPDADPDQVLNQLRKTFSGYTLLRATDASKLMENIQIPLLGEFRIIIVVVSMLISFMVILLAMYTTIFERTREIGILKSLGASRRFIVGMILKESVMISSLGVLLGIVVSEIIRTIILMKFPTMQMAMSLDDLVKGLILGLTAGTLGAVYPAYKAARMDPVKALSYE